jgi:hypothetical protein
VRRLRVVVQVAAQEQPLVGAAAEEEEPHESSQRLVNGQGVDRSSAHGVDDEEEEEPHESSQRLVNGQGVDRSSAHGVDDEGVAGIDPAPRSAYSDA